MITLDSNYNITVDATCYTLRKFAGTNKDGSANWKAVGFYSDLDKALTAYGKQIARDTLANADFTLTEAIVAVKKSNDELALRISSALRRGIPINMRADEVNDYTD